MAIGDTASSVRSARLLTGGSEVYGCMWAAIAAAQVRVRIETYIWKPGAVADRFLQEISAALARGAKVQILLDTFGSDGLPKGYFDALCDAGARIVWFNPSPVLRYSFRNHRKLMTVDSALAIVGGLNIADEYDGDGVTRGWRDFAVELRGPVVAALDESLDRMLELAKFTPNRLRRFALHLRHRRRLRPLSPQDVEDRLLLSGPGTRSARMPHALRVDLSGARDVLVYAAYLLPTVRIRRAIRSVARRGRVRMMTGTQTDVPLVRWAAQRLYPFWLRGGVQLYEYDAQVVHAKLIVIDDIVYAGSANLDIRSLRINYELLVRIPSADLAAQVRAAFVADEARATHIDHEEWLRKRHWWQWPLSFLAYELLVRVDPYLARRRLRRLA
jgi:cardiolipin synthase